MKFNDYINGKEIFKRRVLINESKDNFLVIEKYNEYLKSINYDLDKLFEANSDKESPI